MRILKVLSVLVALAGVGVLALLAAPSVYGQRAEMPRARSLTVQAGRGAEIGVTIGDVASAEKGPAQVSGAVVEDVQADSPAEKAGLKQGDVIVEFDGEHVRSARQFTRLVQETAPGRTVKATLVRDGQRKDVEITPDEARHGRDDVLLDGQRLRDSLGDLGRFTDRMLPFNFDGGNFSFAFPGHDGRGRLGVSVEELTPQLATYFGAKDGVLVASVSEESPASRAGLKAGDVITKVNNEPVRSRDDLLRLLRDVKDGDVTIGIVRDRKESTVTAKIEARRPARTGTVA
jgi:S1-C subfamily serine protease